MSAAEMRNDPGHDGFRHSVGERERRKLDARRSRRRDFWSWVGVFGMVGWSVAVPAIVGALVGRWLDGRGPGPVSWTVTLLFAGLTVGCVVAWRWVRQESRRA